MIPSRPQVDPNGRYSQRQAAELLGVERHTIRRWELDGLIVFKIRKAGKSKYTTGKQIVKCWEASYL